METTASVPRRVTRQIASERSGALTLTGLLDTLVHADWRRRLQILRLEPTLLHPAVAKAVHDRDAMLAAVIDAVCREGIEAVAEACEQIVALTELARTQSPDSSSLETLKNIYDFITDHGAQWLASSVVTILESLSESEPLRDPNSALRANIGRYYLALSSIAATLEPFEITEAYRLACAEWTEVWRELETRQDLESIANAASVVAATEQRYGVESDAHVWAGQLRDLCLTAEDFGIEVARNTHRLVIQLDHATSSRRRWRRKDEQRLGQIAQESVDWFTTTGVGWILLPAIDALRSLEARLAATSRYRPNVISSLGVLLAESVVAGLSPVKVLAEAIAYEREALDLVPPDDPARGFLASNLCGRLCEAGKCGVSGSSALVEAVDFGRQAVRLMLPDDLGRPFAHANLGIAVSEAVQAGVLDVSEFGEAIEHLRRAVESTPATDSRRGLMAMNMGAQLVVAVELGESSPSDIEEAVRYGREALQLIPDSDPNWSTAASVYASGICLSVEAGALETSALKMALAHDRRALELTPLDHQDRGMFATHLAGQLVSAVEAGILPPAGIEEAVALAREAHLLTPSDHPCRTMVAENLATTLIVATEVGLLSHAATREAAAVLMETEEVLPRVALRQSRMSALRADHLMDLVDAKLVPPSYLSGATAKARAVVEASPQGSLSRAKALSKLALLVSRSVGEQLADSSEIDQAISYAREALELTPHDHHDRAGRLSNLGIELAVAVRIGAMPAEVLQEAIALEREALTMSSQKDSKLAGRASSLGIRLSMAFERGVLAPCAMQKDIETVLESLWEAIRRSASTDAARRTRVSAVQSAVARLPELAIAIGDGAFALEVVESLRNHLFEDPLPLRAPLDAPEDLAAEYNFFRMRLDEVQLRHRDGLGPMLDCRAALDDLNDIADKVRRTSNGFASRPTAKDLVSLVPDGSLMIHLVAGQATGAAIVCGSALEPFIVLLPLLTDPETAWRINAYRTDSSKLSGVGIWLWHAVFEPLQDLVRGVSELIVIPTGATSLLPLHAAMTTSGTAVDDNHALRVLPSASLLRFSPNAALESSPLTVIADFPDHKELEWLQADVAVSHAAFGPHKTLVQREAKRDSVLSALESATHATIGVHATYTESGAAALRLADGLLGADEIRRLTNRSRGLAVLSACMSGATDLTMLDENFGLPNALLRAGFQGVVVTNWPVGDLVAFVTIARLRELQGVQPTRPPHDLLREVRQWLRSLTREGLRTWLSQLASSVAGPTSLFDDQIKKLKNGSADYLIFADPVDWAAFTYIGR